MNVEEMIAEGLTNLPDDWQADYLPESDNGEGDRLLLTVNGQEILFTVLSKKIHRKESLKLLAETPDQNRLLVCEPMSDFLRQYCHQQNINYLDRAGNARIVKGSFYTLIQGQKQSIAPVGVSPMSIGIAKCLFAFFSQEDLLNKTYQEIADKAGVSLGMVSKTMQFLIRQNHIPASKRNRRLLDIKELQYHWLTAYHNTLKPKLSSAILPPPQEWQSVPLDDGELWGGEAAAAQLTDYLKPQELMLFSHGSGRDKKYPIGHQGEPPIKLVQAFWGKGLTVNSACVALLTIAELLASNDSRNREVAEMINDHYLHLKQLP